MDIYRKERRQTGNGKGDKRRPTDEDTYRKNYDTINWKKKNEKLGNRAGNT